MVEACKGAKKDMRGGGSAVGRGSSFYRVMYPAGRVDKKSHPTSQRVPRSAIPIHQSAPSLLPPATPSARPLSGRSNFRLRRHPLCAQPEYPGVFQRSESTCELDELSAIRLGTREASVGLAAASQELIAVTSTQLRRQIIAGFG